MPLTVRSPAVFRDGRASTVSVQAEKAEHPLHNEPPEKCKHVAHLHAVGSTDYAMEFDGERIVESSRDPETDLARALLARGIVGAVKVLDGITGQHRSTVNIANAARVTFVETGTYPRAR